MTQSSPPTLAYASPDTRPRRWSKSAIVSILIPILAVPATVMLVEVLENRITWRMALGVAGVFEGVAFLAGLTIAVAALVHVRRSAGRLRGRMLVLIGIALNAVGIAMVISGFYIRSLW
jgi:hypothetical protein